MAEDFEDLKFDILDVCEQYADDNIQSNEEEARESLNQAIRMLQICKDPR